MSRQSNPTIWTIALAVSAATLLAVSANGQDAEETVPEPSIKRGVLAPNEPIGPSASMRGERVRMRFGEATPQPQIQPNRPTPAQPRDPFSYSRYSDPRAVQNNENEINENIINMLRRENAALKQLVQANFAGAAKPKNLAPLEDGVLRAFRLQHIAPELLAETLESFLGESQLRLVPDLANNMLIVYAKENVLGQISELVETLDQNPESRYESNEEEAVETQSLLIRIFWLIDDDSTPVSYMEPTEYLPESVLQAVGQLGLQSPRLVTQSSTSVYTVVGEGTNFSLLFPAIVSGETLLFQSLGTLFFQHLPAHDLPMPLLELEVEVQGGQNPIKLEGRLSAPLGHYMVLGTTNYATGRKLRRRDGGGLGKEGRSEVQEQPTTSRFAFVVQVVEAKSYAPEE